MKFKISRFSWCSEVFAKQADGVRKWELKYDGILQPGCFIIVYAREIRWGVWFGTDNSFGTMETRGRSIDEIKPEVLDAFIRHAPIPPPLHNEK